MEAGNERLSSCELYAKSQLDKSALKKLICSAVLCFVFMVGEIIGGILANSLAIGTDASHLLADLISFIISIISIYLAARPPGSKLNFGWDRAETIGALLSVVLIWLVTVVLVGLAVLRIKNGEFEIDCNIMLITSAAGLFLNIIMMIVLHGDSHHHHHDDHHHVRDENHGDTNLLPGPQSNCCEQQTHRLTPNACVNQLLCISTPVTIVDDLSNGQLENVSLLTGTVNSECQDVVIVKNRPVMTRSSNINVRAAFIHVLGDLIQSIGVVVAALIIYFKPEYKIADPICTFVFSFLVLCTTFQILRDTLSILMEACPNYISHDEIKSCLSTVPGVKSVHNLRIWILKSDKLVASVHLVLEKRSPEETGSSQRDSQVLVAAQKVFRKLFYIQDCTIQLETFDQSIVVEVPDESLLEP